VRFWVWGNPLSKQLCVVLGVGKYKKKLKSKDLM